MPSSLGGKVRVSCHACATARSGVWRFQSIQGLNDDEYGSRALGLRVMCTKTSRLSSKKSGRLWYGRGDNDASRLILAAVVVIR